VLALVALVAPVTALALYLGHQASARRASTGGMPTAHSSNGVPQIGALYASSHATQHMCTASVVHSPHGNTLITAAHCIAGGGAGMVFAPGQHGAHTPDGRWTVTAAYVESRWLSRQDQRADIAFLTVAPRVINGVSTEIEQVTGAYQLGPTAVRGERVTVSGYPAGSVNDPITCTARVYLTKRFPSFDCRGFIGGTSGSPWLRVTKHGTEIVGVIGGLYQGGCYDYTSYSSRLAGDADSAYGRASEQREPADVAPRPGDDGC